MKKILAPIDFSVSSENACEYAAEMAATFGTHLQLFHAYFVPVISSEVPEAFVDLTETENRLKKIMTQKAESLAAKYKLKVGQTLKYGPATNEILSEIEEEKIDLIIMGISDMDRISRFILGSTTTGVIKNTNAPVLVIPDNYKFQKINKIIIARENSPINAHCVKVLQYFMKHFNSEIHILEVIEEYKMSPELIVDTRVEAIRGLESLNPKLKLIVREDIEKTINEYSHENHIDMMVILPKKHNFLEEIVKGSFTKKMVFKTDIPLLALHGDS